MILNNAKILVDDLTDFFFPKICLLCQSSISSSENCLCISCQSSLSFADFNSLTHNDITRLMQGRIKVENAITLLYSEKKSPARELLYHLKYRKKEYLGGFFANLFIEKLKRTPLDDKIDIAFPVPISPKSKRGYNQVSQFAKKLSAYLKADYREDVLIKKPSRISQAQKNRWKRWVVNEEVFTIKNATGLKGKHVLIVDDIITTGNTLQDCISQIEDIPQISVSIATIAMAK